MSTYDKSFSCVKRQECDTDLYEHNPSKDRFKVCKTRHMDGYIFLTGIVWIVSGFRSHSDFLVFTKLEFYLTVGFMLSPRCFSLGTLLTVGLVYQ